MSESSAPRDPGTPPPLPRRVPASVRPVSTGAEQTRPAQHRPAQHRPAQTLAGTPASRTAPEQDAPPSRRLMFVTVGTDHHPFERLVAWAERWAEQAAEWEVHVQHGRTRAPRVGVGFDFCDHDRLQQLFATADVVVSHGGPASITEARRFGHRPVVVPRDPGRGEHVDNHQQLFVARLAASGLVERVETEDDFVATVVAQAYLPRQRTSGDEVPAGVFRVGRIAERLVARRSAGRRR